MYKEDEDNLLRDNSLFFDEIFSKAMKSLSKSLYFVII